MSSIKRALTYLKYDRNQFFDSLVKNFGRFLPDKVYLSLRYRFLKGKWIDWDNPITFTEKIQWLKVYRYKPIYTRLVDKLAVKEYVTNKIGSKYIIPTIATFKSPHEVDWDSLPEQFVLKTTHGGGSCGVVICSDKNKFDKKKAIEKLNKSYKKRAGRNYREHPYYSVPKRIIAERYMCQHDISGNPLTGSLIDYKFYCFHGEPKFCQVIRDRDTVETIDFYDMQWQLQPFVGLNPKCRNAKSPLSKPRSLDEMVYVCRQLSDEAPFVRVDLFEIDSVVYFGELTFYPAGGMGIFTPSDWDYKLGKMLRLK